jgi:hypothetical protein
MSASRSNRSSRSSRSARAPKKLKKASPAVAAARAPWIFEGIDYGPARAAVRDLANWALDIAERAVDDWPVGQLHVRNTRRFVSARIEGKTPRRVSVDDVLFTAELLARIFDEDLGLGLSEALTILETLELPLDPVPVHRQAPRMSKVVPLRTTLQSLARSAMTSSPASVAPLRLCDACGYVHELGDHVRHRNAA